jgi:hypothetical protein
MATQIPLSDTASPSPPPPAFPLVTSNSPLVTAVLIATHQETGFLVTPTKQTTVVLSNRNKKTPPPGGVAFWLLPGPGLHPLTGTHSKTGIAVNPARSTTCFFYPVQKALPPGGGEMVIPRALEEGGGPPPPGGRATARPAMKRRAGLRPAPTNILKQDDNVERHLQQNNLRKAKRR